MKHLFAYSSLGGVLSTDNAEKNVMNQKFYYDEKQTCELILKDGNINAKHFAFKKDATIEVNGNTYPVDSINESPAHFNLKMRIKKYERFTFGGNTIFLKNVKVEFQESTFRYDLKAELHCGTPCVIEVIRSSKTALKKEEYLRKKQLLTFEIFIDKDGLQNIRQFNLYGNEQLERIIKERIINDIRVKSIQDGLHYSKERERRGIDSGVNERIESLKNQIKEEGRVFNTFTSEEREYDIDYQDQFNKIGKAIKSCRESKQEIKQSEDIYRERRKRKENVNDKIKRFELEVEELEGKFEKATKNCKIEWFTPNFMKKENKLSEFKYWTS
ncbi:MAG: hypothetical protein ACI9QD_001128 [Thermoproteota archaeon]|jgi:hypothetical protein